NGVALSPWLGRKVAYRALGDPRGETAFAKTALETRPYHIGGAPWFMPIASAWWSNVVDRGQMRAARRDRG
ncbi:MAG: FAD-binding oxidoreductase, partial [Pseudomonadota bacterium]